MLLQIQYHIGNHGQIAINDTSLGIDYHGWTVVHKVAIVALTLFMMYHFYHHWTWYKTVITKKRFVKNQQVLVFSLLFLCVAMTGLMPWFIHLFSGDEVQRKGLIEVHDKLAILLSIYLVLHITKRLKWYMSAFKKQQK